MVSIDVILIGPPGAGKSTVGRLVAQQLDRPFVDTDDLIETEQERSIRDIFVLDGEDEFRRLEVEATRRALDGDGVVALGGGAPMQPPIEQMLTDRHVVFLDVAIADAAGRIGFNQSRPLLAVNPRATWTRMMDRRRPTYERLADQVVDTAGRDAQDVAAEVVSCLKDAAR